MSIRPTAVIAAAAAALAATLMTGPAASASRQQSATHWSASWTSAMQQPTPSTPAMGENWSMTGFSDQTVRQEVRVSGGGNVARARLSNLDGTEPLRLAGATTPTTWKGNPRARGTPPTRRDSRAASTARHQNGNRSRPQPTPIKEHERSRLTRPPVGCSAQSAVERTA
jgi:hypothetical protein